METHKILWDFMIKRKEGGRGQASMEDSVDSTIRRLGDYIKKHGERLIRATKNNTDNTRINITKITRKQKWEEKQLQTTMQNSTREN